MHHPTDRTVYTMAFVIPVVEQIGNSSMEGCPDNPDLYVKNGPPSRLPLVTIYIQHHKLKVILLKKSLNIAFSRLESIRTPSLTAQFDKVKFTLQSMAEGYSTSLMCRWSQADNNIQLGHVVWKIHS